MINQNNQMRVTNSIFDYNRNVLSAKEVNWTYFLLGANVVDDLAFIVKSLIIVACYHKTCVNLHNLDEPMPVFSFEIYCLSHTFTTYILNKKQIQTNCISWKAWDD